MGRPNEPLPIEQANYNPGEDEEFEHEMTINDEVDPDDLIRTMDPAQIDKFIPKKKFDRLVKDHPNLGEDTCTICIDFIKNGELLRVIPLCGHIFHAECLLTWLQVNEVCPNCKNEVSIYTLRAYFESMRSRKDKASPNKLESRKIDENANNRPESRPGITHSSLHPRSMTLNNLSQATAGNRIRIEELGGTAP